MAVTAGTPLILLCKLLKIGDGKWRHGNNDSTEAGVCNAAFQFNVGGVNYKRKKKTWSFILLDFDNRSIS